MIMRNFVVKRIEFDIISEESMRAYLRQRLASFIKKEIVCVDLYCSGVPRVVANHAFKNRTVVWVNCFLLRIFRGSVARSITAVRILTIEAVTVQVSDHFPPKQAVIVRVFSA